MSEVRLGYASSKNITFKGTIPTGIDREEWERWSDKERERFIDEIMYELVEIWELDDE